MIKINKLSIYFAVLFSTTTLTATALAKESDVCQPASNFVVANTQIKQLAINYYQFDSIKNSAQKYNLKDSESGKTVLINLWATWCKPCREELPMLNALNAMHQAKNAAKYDVILINLGDKLADINKLFTSLEIDNLVSYQQDDYKLIQDFNLQGLPASIVIQKVGDDNSPWFVSQGKLKTSPKELDSWLSCLSDTSPK